MVLYNNFKTDKNVRRKTQMTHNALFKHMRRIVNEHRLTNATLASVDIHNYKVRITTNAGVIYCDYDMFSSELKKEDSAEVIALREKDQFLRSLGRKNYRFYREQMVRGGVDVYLPSWNDLSEKEKKSWDFAAREILKYVDNFTPSIGG